MMNKPVRTKLDYTVPRKERSSRDKMLEEKDRQYKETMTDEGGISKEHNFVRGENADERGQSEDWRDSFDGGSNMKGQPIYQKDAEEENLLELPEQEASAEPVQETPMNRAVMVAVNRNEEQQKQIVRKWICQARQSKTILCHPVVPQDPVDRK